MVVAQGMEGEREGKTMAALRPRSRQWTAKVRGGSSSNSKSLRSTDVSDPSLVVPIRSNAKPKFTTKDRHDYVRPYAMDAISVYNERAGTKYELVEPGNITTVLLSRRRLHHIDFTAKKTDVADAPVEMFFAELITLNKEIKTMDAVIVWITMFSIPGVEDSWMAVLDYSLVNENYNSLA
ncbi:hypothetical protein C5167_007061 [Papaver somniferum]|uniref:DUF3615 domain-containing protein n=1 Tax=Papaver somniferum TaxID=3469 RepID=A0A4Y7JI62_PAPSO|nr:hypothetical protein C5167_007061 [Papaver somniferum]